MKQLFFFKCENRFFHLLTKKRLDPYFTHLCYAYSRKKRDDSCHNSGYPIPVQGTQEIAERERESPIWPTLGVCASGTQRSRQPVLPNATENPVLSEPYLSLAIIFNT